MQIRVVTLPWDAQSQSFSESRLIDATSGKDVLSAEERWATIDGRDVLVLTLKLTNSSSNGGMRPYNGGNQNNQRSKEAMEFINKLEAQMPVETKAAFYRLKDWRTEKMKALGCPAFAIATNRQLAELALNAPKTLKDVSQIHGISKHFVTKNGEAVLEMLKGLTPVEYVLPETTGEDKTQKKGAGEKGAGKAQEHEAESALGEEQTEEEFEFTL